MGGAMADKLFNPAANRLRKNSAPSQSKSYFSHHRFVAVQSLSLLLKAPVATFFTWLVIAIAIVLPASLLLMLSSLQNVARDWHGGAQISLFMAPAVEAHRLSELVETIGADTRVMSVELIKPEDALIEFQQQSGLTEVLATLGTNPLPPVLVLRPHMSGMPLSDMENLAMDMKVYPEVASVVLDAEWVRRLQGMLAFGRQLALVVGVILVMGVLLVIGNTIRLAIESRKDEIVVTKMVGATDAFVRRPFLYTGFWYGLGGGLLAAVIIFVALRLLLPFLSELLKAYNSQSFDLSLSGLLVMSMALGGALLGIIGAWLAVRRHLGAIEPR